MTVKDEFGLGLIGCGSFGLFSLKAFGEIPGVRIAAISDARRDTAEMAARQFGVAGLDEPGELISRDDVDIVYIATPPSSHCELAMAAIRGGKHVVCEKPPATSLRDATHMLTAARDAGVILPVNFVLRYNAVTQAVKAVIDSGVLGRVLSGRLTNCAFDTLMPPEHWFWDKNISGGIFIEHGVHFFDLYRYWLGPGEVLSAHGETREGTGQEDRVLCDVRHEDGTVVGHYHGFDQIQAMDRADHRLVCEMGDICVEGWVPLTLRVDGAVDDEGLLRLGECVPDGSVNVIEEFPGRSGETFGRGKKRCVTRRIALNYTPQPDKQTAYTEGLRRLLTDQIAFLRDPNHPRRVTEQNGRDALALAESATRLAAESE